MWLWVCWAFGSVGALRLHLLFIAAVPLNRVLNVIFVFKNVLGNVINRVFPVIKLNCILYRFSNWFFLGGDLKFFGSILLDFSWFLVIIRSDCLVICDFFFFLLFYFFDFSLSGDQTSRLFLILFLSCLWKVRYQACFNQLALAHLCNLFPLEFGLR